MEENWIDIRCKRCGKTVAEHFVKVAEPMTLLVDECYECGKEDGLGEAEEAFNRGYDQGFADGREVSADE